MRESKLTIVYPLFMLLVSFPLIHAWFPLSERFIILSLPLVLCSFAFNSKAILSSSMIPVAIYILFLFSNTGRNSYVSSITFLDTAYLLSGSIISCYLINNQHSKILDQIIKVAFVFIGVTCFSSILISLANPGAVRMNAINDVYEASPIIFAMRKYGLSNYALPHALPILIPGVVKIIKDPNVFPNKKLYLKVFLLLIIIFEWYAESATGAILSLFALCASYSIKLNGKHNIRRIVLLSIVTLMLTSEFIMVPILDLLIGISPDSYAAKLIDFQLQLQGIDTYGDAYTRANLYNDSWNVFLDNMMLGYKGNNLLIGGHSAILDHLATTGLVGFIPWIFIMITQFKQNWVRLSANLRLYYLIGCVCFVLMLSLKNMSVYIVWLMFMVYLPAFLLYNPSMIQKEK